jgi:hypothetical protein
MEEELARIGRGLGRKFPNHVERFFLKNAE